MNLKTAKKIRQSLRRLGVPVSGTSYVAAKTVRKGADIKVVIGLDPECGRAMYKAAKKVR